MTHDTDNAPADIAWMRRLAEEGSTAPMQGGSILMAAGLVYGVTSLLHWAHMTGVIAPRLVASGMEWLIATGLFLVINFALILRMRRREGVRTVANRATGVVWGGVGIGIFALFASMLAVSAVVDSGNNEIAFALVPSIIMVFYGMGWSVSAALQKSGGLWLLGIASFVAAPTLGLLAGQPAQYLGYAAALFLLMALPGFLLMRQTKSV